jgi:hypothetical protein
MDADGESAGVTRGESAGVSPPMAVCEIAEVPLEEPPFVETEADVTKLYDSSPIALPMKHDNENEESEYGENGNDEVDSRHDVMTDEVLYPDSMTPSVQRIHCIWPKKSRDYIHLHVTVVYHAMTQYSLKRGFEETQEGQKSSSSYT